MISGLEIVEEINTQESILSTILIKINNFGNLPFNIWQTMTYQLFSNMSMLKLNKKFIILDIAKEQYKCLLPYPKEILLYNNIWINTLHSVQLHMLKILNRI